MRTTFAALGLWTLLTTPTPVGAQHVHSLSPDSKTSHLAGVNKRGDMAMGFDHSKTTHHFRLFKDGGAIGVETNDPKDTGNRDAIRRHLHQIRQMFAEGNFALPTDEQGNTPLFIASWYGNAEAVRLLLARGANRSAINLKGQTALDVARRNGHREIVSLLSVSRPCRRRGAGVKSQAVQVAAPVVF